MKLWFGYFVCACVCASLGRAATNQDVDGTIVWVDNDKKEKDITVGKPTTAGSEDLKLWNFADNRINNVESVDEGEQDKNSKVSTPKYVGTEDTPSVYDKHKPKVSTNNKDTVDAEYISDEESNGDSLENDDHALALGSLSLGDSPKIDNQNHVGAESPEFHEDYQEITRSSHDTNSHVTAINSEAEELVNGHGQWQRSEFETSPEDDDEDEDDDETEADETGQTKSLVEKRPKSSHKKRPKSSHKKRPKSSHKKRPKSTHRKKSKKAAKGRAKSVIGSRKSSVIPDAKEIRKAKSMLYDGVHVKRDDIGRLTPYDDDDVENGELREKMGNYAPDDKEISEVVSHFTDNKKENNHRMDHDELQMHLDDEALKMEVKAIEDEDSNVRSVLQGSSKFSNDRKLNYFEGDFEKDIIKNFGKSGLELQGIRDSKGFDAKARKERKDDDRSDEDGPENDEEEENRERKFKEDERENEDEKEDNDRENDESAENRNMDRDRPENNDSEEEEEHGDRKDLVTEHSDSQDGRKFKKSHRTAKKYNFYSPTGKLGGDISPTEEAEMGVNIDNQAMETEIKQIQNEDAKVSAALEGIGKGPKLVDFDEYSYDTQDSMAGKAATHHKFSVEINPTEEEDLAGKTNQKHEIGQGDKGSSDSPLGDDIRAMLRETSRVLNETNAVLNEGKMATHRSSEVLNAMMQKNTSDANTNATSMNEMPYNATVNNTGSNENASMINGSATVNSGNATAYNTSATTANVNATTGNSSNINRTQNEFVPPDSGKFFESESAKSDDEYIEMGHLSLPSKRDIKAAKLKRKQKGKGRHFKFNSKHAMRKSNRIKNKARVGKRYTNGEMKILNLMYKSPMFASVRNHIEKFRQQQHEKRSYTPSLKTTYRRFKKPRIVRKRGQFTKKRIEAGKKRGSVEEGMTGAISYTNRDGNEFMFAVSKQLLTWSEANSKCRSLGGELLSIGDKEEQEFIQANVIPERAHYWIGFTDQENEGTWQWTDRTPVRFSNWSNLEPDDGNIKSGEATHNEDCAVINPTMDWSDVPCWNRFQFICKLRPDNGRAISFGGTMSNSDIGNKQFDEFAQSLKTSKKPTVPTKKPVIEGNAKTREKGGEMMLKGYSGSGPSRGGDKVVTMEKGKLAGFKDGEQRDNAAMIQGKQAGVKGGAEAASNGGPSGSAKGASLMEAGTNGLKQTANALNQAAKNAEQTGKAMMAPGNAALQGAKFGPGSTGLGTIPGTTGASINGNAGLGKIGGVDAAGAAPAQVQKGGNGGQSSVNLTPGGGASGGGGGAASAGGGGSGGGGANGGAPGHVATNGGLAQAPSGGGAGGGASGGGASGGGASGGGASGGGASGGGVSGGGAQGGGAPGGGASGGGAPGGGAPGGGAPGGGAPGGGAPGGGAPSGGGVPQGRPIGGAPQVSGGAPAAVQPAPTVAMSGAPTAPTGGAPQLSPEQAAMAKQLANQIAPQLAKEYANKFEPDMEMIQTICGKFCADAAMDLRGEDPSKIGKACGRICAESLMKMSPDEVMGVLAGMRKANNAPPSPQAIPAAANPGIPAQGGAPIGSTGGNMQKGENQPSNGGGGSSNSDGGGNNGGGSNGGGNSGGNNGGGSNWSNNGGGGSNNEGGGGGIQINLGKGSGVNLQTLGSILAPSLGLNIEGNGKISVADGQTLSDKISDAIDSLKNQHKLKTSTASKSTTPQVDTVKKKSKGLDTKDIDLNKSENLVNKMKADLAKGSQLKSDDNKEAEGKNLNVEAASPSKADKEATHSKEDGQSSLGFVMGTKREMKYHKKTKRKPKRKKRKHRHH